MHVTTAGVVPRSSPAGLLIRRSPSGTRVATRQAAPRPAPGRRAAAVLARTRVSGDRPPGLVGEWRGRGSVRSPAGGTDGRGTCGARGKARRQVRCGESLRICVPAGFAGSRQAGAPSDLGHVLSGRLGRLRLHPRPAGQRPESVCPGLSLRAGIRHVYVPGCGSYGDWAESVHMGGRSRRDPVTGWHLPSNCGRALVHASEDPQAITNERRART